MVSYQRLAADHMAVEARLADVLALVDDDDRDVPAVRHELDALRRELDEHLAIEDSALYPRLIVAANPQAAEIGNRFMLDLETLKTDWQTFLLDWSDEMMACDWPEFTSAARVMIERVRTRTRAETNLLYTAALQTSAIPLRDNNLSRAAA